MFVLCFWTEKIRTPKFRREEFLSDASCGVTDRKGESRGRDLLVDVFSGNHPRLVEHDFSRLTSETEEDAPIPDHETWVIQYYQMMSLCSCSNWVPVHYLQGCGSNFNLYARLGNIKPT
jgi:hypothetical protein